ncbi:TPA: lpg1776 family Dot/Icm T4SS effector [Legionella pneumophila]|nr:lpg1776 family Dot/Icm T4SS effector [Legionella pneumophila]HCJ4233776.1 lpg1776 family Dot/Icm T4SS effector [Legionella pneumophila]
MQSKIHKKEDNTNYSFLLKCMAAATAAIVTAVVIKATATAAVGFGVATAGAALSPLLFVGGALLAAVGICCLPLLLCCGSSRSVYTVSSSPAYRPWSSAWYTGYNPTFHSHPVYNNGGTYHTHHSGTVHTHSNPVHTHGNNVHVHATPSNVHGHR